MPRTKITKPDEKAPSNQPATEVRETKPSDLGWFGQMAEREAKKRLEDGLTIQVADLPATCPKCDYSVEGGEWGFKGGGNCKCKRCKFVVPLKGSPIVQDRGFVQPPIESMKVSNWSAIKGESDMTERQNAKEAP